MWEFSLHSPQEGGVFFGFEKHKVLGNDFSVFLFHFLNLHFLLKFCSRGWDVFHPHQMFFF